VVFRGIEAPALQRKAGPFASRKLALEWLEQEGLGSTPSDTGDWAAVYPVSDLQNVTLGTDEDEAGDFIDGTST
jgi:hypothetical protein